MKGHRGPATREALDFDILPGDTPAPTGSDRLHGSFFGSESSGVALRLVGLGFAVADFAGGKHALQKTPAEALNRRLNAIDLRNINAGSHDQLDTISAGLPLDGVK